MIKLTDNEGNNYEFELTRFPDQTSQAWKITPEPKRMTVINVNWLFESEAELFHVCQLGTLLYKHFYCFPTLVVPYLPYARQDKKVANDLTFARDVFLNLVTTAGFTKIRSYDAHSGSVYVQSQEPVELLETALKDGYTTICFPDKGAKERYTKLVPAGIKVIYGDKRRNQQTGTIEGINIEVPEDFGNESVLVFDDLADGGGTFIGVAKELQNKGITNLGLAVSHGLFSKGLDILFDSGYNHIYTTNSLLKNSEIGTKFLSYSHGRELSDRHDLGYLTVIKVV